MIDDASEHLYRVDLFTRALPLFPDLVPVLAGVQALEAARRLATLALAVVHLREAEPEVLVEQFQLYTLLEDRAPATVRDQLTEVLLACAREIQTSTNRVNRLTGYQNALIASVLECKEPLSISSKYETIATKICTYVVTLRDALITLGERIDSSLQELRHHGFSGSLDIAQTQHISDLHSQLYHAQLEAAGLGMEWVQIRELSRRATFIVKLE